MAQSKGASVAATRSRPFKWLEDYDRRARNLAQANDWTRYSPFAFARFPRLQPTAPTYGRESFFRTISCWEKRLTADPKTKLVLTELSQNQRTQLAGLVCDTMNDLELFVNRRKNRKQFHKLAIEGPSWKRKLQSKYRAACNAVEDLSKCCSKRDSIVSFDYGRRAKAAIEALRCSEAPRDPTLKYAAAIRDDLGAITCDPTTDAMVQLYWFFRSECELSGHEAEVRTALIRNAFWTQLGIRKVRFREKYQDAESQGCDAVKQAVRRFTSHQGTTR